LDKIRKIGAWLWYAKERMVLVVVVGLLCWQMYQVANPKPPDEMVVVPPPLPKPPDDWEGGPPWPPPGPPRKGPEDWRGLYARNPMWVFAHSPENDNISDRGEQDPGIRLLKIMEMPDGSVRAWLETNTREWYLPGDKFESFELLSIDPEAQTCEVFSEKLAQPITLHVSGR
jgi:hypothetical protein